eukprot:ctg_3780.g604
MWSAASSTNAIDSRSARPAFASAIRGACCSMEESATARDSARVAMASGGGGSPGSRVPQVDAQSKKWTPHGPPRSSARSAAALSPTGTHRRGGRAVTRSTATAAVVASRRRSGPPTAGRC